MYKAPTFSNLDSARETDTPIGGDASMELIMAAQVDASPWEIPPSLSLSPTSQPPPPATNQSSQAPSTASTTSPETEPEPTLLGRGYFSHLGLVRRKPARGDAPPTLSKSCSDKIALKQCTSLLSSLTSLLVSPQNVYLSTLVLPESQFSAVACERCFSPNGRMSALTTGTGQGEKGGREWGGGYRFVPFEVQTTGLEFDFSKREVAGRSDKTVASNLAVAWWRDGKGDEGLIGGVLQGRKKVDIKSASAVSRRKMWGLAVEVLGLLDPQKWGEVGDELVRKRYEEVKGIQVLAAREKAKREVRRDALKGWVRNIGDRDFVYSS